MKHQKDNIINQYKELKNRIESYISSIKYSSTINLKLERITHLLKLLGNPHYSYDSIHIGGTSGKGSTAVMTSYVLENFGYKTGLHISPHLQILNERFQINNKIASTSKLLKLFNEIEPAIKEVAQKNPFGTPSHFEVLTSLAFLYFQIEAVDVAVIEVSLGGSLDPTNVLPSNVAVLTSIGLDHIDILGDTIEKIAIDKSGIIKENQVVISGIKQEEARRIVFNKCIKEKATLWQLGQNFDYEILENGKFNLLLPSQTYPQIELGLNGNFQFSNAACAIAAVKAYNNNIPEAAIRKGLREAQIPCRMEIIQDNPLVILDGSHNPDQIKETSKAISNFYGNKRIIAIISIKSDKPANEILPYIIDKSETIIISEFYSKGFNNPTRSESIIELIQKIAPNKKSIIKEIDPIKAIRVALKKVNKESLIWVTGSLYFASDVREYWLPYYELLLEAENYK